MAKTPKRNLPAEKVVIERLNRRFEELNPDGLTEYQEQVSRGVQALLTAWDEKAVRDLEKALKKSDYGKKFWDIEAFSQRILWIIWEVAPQRLNRQNSHTFRMDLSVVSACVDKIALNLGSDWFFKRQGWLKGARGSHHGYRKW